MDTLENKIAKIKKEKNAFIIAHNYSPMEIQKIADIVGDSYQLAVAAQEIENKLIIFCGVRFMAETAKLLNPNSKVILANQNAGCPMADMADFDDVREFRKNNPDHIIVCYVNSSIEVKALSDVCVTSSNAVKIVSNITIDKKIMFIPDKNLGNYVAKMTNREIELWDGLCPIHHTSFTVEAIHHARRQYPDHKIIVHPECTPAVVALADYVGSTRALAEFTQSNDKVVIGTEIGLIQMLKEKYTEKSIIPLSENAICKNMKKTTLDDVLNALKYEQNETIIPDDIAVDALRPIKKMIEMSK